MLAGVVVVALAACGGSGGGSSPAADLQTAQNALIQPGDVPDHPQVPAAQAKNDRANDNLIADSVKSCMHADGTFFEHDAVGGQAADSPLYRTGPETISTRVVVYPSKRALDDRWALFARTDFDGCFDAALTKALKPGTRYGLPAGVTVGKVQVLRRSVSFGDHAIIFEINVPLSAGGLKTEYFVGLYVVQRGRAGVTLEAASNDPKLNRSDLLARSDILLRTMMLRLHDVS
jgi:hypothetical protein